MCRSLSMPSLWARPTGLYAIRKDSTHFQFTLCTGLLYLRGKERRESFHFLSPHPSEIDFDPGFLGSVVLSFNIVLRCRDGAHFLKDAVIPSINVVEWLVRSGIRASVYR